MATERRRADPRLGAQAQVLRGWGQAWRKLHGKNQQDLGRLAGYGSDESPKSAAVAISRIESGKTSPSGEHRRQLLATLNRTESELDAAIENVLAATRAPSAFERMIAGSEIATNEELKADIRAESDMLAARTQYLTDEADRVFELATQDFVTPFLELADSIAWPFAFTAPKFRDNADVMSGVLDAQIISVRSRTRLNLIRAIADSAASAGAGAGAGAGAAMGLFAAVSASATASTGSAIASLAGAASSRATLAWLGGGTLSSGGLGIAGGRAILAGVAMLPAMLAMGGLLVWKGWNFRQETQAEAERLRAARVALDQMKSALPRAEGWVRRQQLIIQRASLLGRTVQAEFIEPEIRSRSTAGAQDPIPFDDLPPPVRDALRLQLELLTTIVTLRALPVWLGLTAVQEQDTDSKHEAGLKHAGEWIDQSLALADADLDEREQRVREIRGGADAAASAPLE